MYRWIFFLATRPIDVIYLNMVIMITVITRVIRRLQEDNRS